MGAKKDHKQFLEELAAKSVNVTALEPYIDSKTPIACKCNICGNTWRINPNNLLRGYGCPVCGLKKRATSRTKDHNSFVSELQTISPSVLVQEKYKGARIPLKCKCNDCGYVWNAAPTNLLKGKKCPTCASKKRAEKQRRTNDDFLALIHELGHNIEPVEEYKGSMASIRMKCNDCGYRWGTSASSVIAGSGCPRCARNGIYTQEEFVNKLRVVNPHIQVVSDYIRSAKPIKCKCLICGHVWETTPNNLLTKKGCPNCYHSNTSFFEQVILEVFMLVVGENGVVAHDRKSIGKELDVYVPKWRTGIEYDGKAFHSNDRANKKAIQKYTVCKENSIRLIRVSELPSDDGYSDLFIYRHELTSKGLNDCINTVLSTISTDNIDVDVDRDRNIIHKRYISIIKNKSIAVRSPELVQEWDYEKNSGITPEMVNSLSNIKYWWICPNGHSYQAAPANRSAGNSGCPYCSNHKVLPGFNDLATKYPDIAKEWDYEKNNDTKPEQVMPGSQKYYYWKCDKGHSFKMRPNERTSSKQNCPYCSGHAVLKGFNDIATTNPEVLELWDFEKNKNGPSDYSSGSGYEAWWKCAHGHSWHKRISSQIRHNYCPVCSGKVLVTGFNDLSTTNPDLVKEWNYEKNSPLTPDHITRFYSNKIWWKCSTCGHEWPTLISIRLKGAGCPKCGYSSKMQTTISKNARLQGRDLQHKFPEIATEWDYEKNYPLTPSDVSYGSNKKVWWKCPICSRSYQAWISDRTGKHKTGCPSCSHKKKPQ